MNNNNGNGQRNSSIQGLSSSTRISKASNRLASRELEPAVVSKATTTIATAASSASLIGGAAGASHGGVSLAKAEKPVARVRISARIQPGGLPGVTIPGSDPAATTAAGSTPPSASHSTGGAARAAKIRVLPVDSHPMVLEGVRSCLCRHRQFDVVDVAVTGTEAVNKATRLCPDVVLMDMSGPDEGLEATRRLREACPETKVVMFVTREDKEAVQQMVQAGAKGCIRKTASPDELVGALERVHNGETFFSADVAQMFFDDYIMRGGKPAPARAHAISERERQVLRLVVDGAANKVIAGTLNISIRTVEKHRQRIMKKFDLHKATDLVRVAITKGIVPVNR